MVDPPLWEETGEAKVDLLKKGILGKRKVRFEYLWQFREVVVPVALRKIFLVEIQRMAAIYR